MGWLPGNGGFGHQISFVTGWEGFEMDSDEFEGTARDIGGKVQDAVGGLTGDAATQAKGKVNQVRGKAQKTFGAASEELRDSIVDQPLTALAIVAGAAFLLGFLSRR
jgi:uncharacterized protein YjbJ (UPF0337 family)